MKRCPKCSRTFPDENQKFCTFDGGLLRADQPAFDPNLTVRATSKDLYEPTPGSESDASEATTSVRLQSLNETITSFGTSTFPERPSGSDTTGDLSSPESAPTSLDLSAYAPTPAPPPPGPPSRPIAPTASKSAPPARPSAPVSQPSAALPAPAAGGTPVPQKRSMMPLILGGLAVLLLLLGGAGAAGYFFVLKPMLAQRQGVVVNEPTNVNESTNVNANTAPTPVDTSTPANANTVETKKEPEPFTAPADTVQFTNSAANLDGDLADHYVGFSFYYPKGWTRDPKSGVPGASNFAQVDLPYSDPTYLKERVVFNWYPSKGTYESDVNVFPQSARKISDQLSKGLQNFEEVSHGETTVGSYKGYEVRFKGVFKDTGKGDLPYWGRVLFLPPGSETEKGGVAIIMLATSLSQDVTSAADVGDKGGMALILESFRFASR